MTPHDLIAAFNAVAEAPDGVVRLRELILQLAVRGRLVPQDPTDEPARVLLERIAAERARLFRTGKIRAPRALPELPDDPAFDLPGSWCWTHLASIVPWDLTDGDWVESKDQDPSGEVRLAQLADVGVGRFLDKSRRFLTTDAAARLRCTYLEREDVLIARLPEPLGRACVFPGLSQPAVTVVDVAIARCQGPSVFPHFLAHLLNSPLIAGRIKSLAAGTTRARVSTGNLRGVVVPVAPLAEQHRIVARVHELMGLLDKLEAARSSRDTTRAAARDSALASLRQADTPDEVEVAWNRFAVRVDELVIDPTDIAPLRQTVIELAMRGRLVAQDASDVPASTLLNCVSAEGNGRRGTQPRLPENNAPFRIPGSWIWATLDDLFDPQRRASYGVLVPGPDVRGGVPLVRVADLSRDPPLRPEKSIASSVAEQYARVRLRGDELLVGVVGSIGKVGVARPEWAGAVVARAVVRFGVSDQLAREYVLLALMSPFSQAYFQDVTRTLAQPTLNVGQLCRLPVPLPPLPEQHRIVARVHELMSLLDRLEERLATARTTHAAFAAAAVHHVDA